MSDSGGTVYLVDDDPVVLGALARLLESAGHRVSACSCGMSFLEMYSGEPGCLVVDLNLPGLDGVAVQSRLLERGWSLPVLFLSGAGTVAQATQVLRRGAIDFLEKPVADDLLLQRVSLALAEDALERLAKLSQREVEVTHWLVQGCTVKEIGLRLELSPKTVHTYRAQALAKTHTRSVVELARLSFDAGMPETAS